MRRCSCRCMLSVHARHMHSTACVVSVSVLRAASLGLTSAHIHRRLSRLFLNSGISCTASMPLPHMMAMTSSVMPVHSSQKYM